VEKILPVRWGFKGSIGALHLRIEIGGVPNRGHEEVRSQFAKKVWKKGLTIVEMGYSFRLKRIRELIHT